MQEIVAMGAIWSFPCPASCMLSRSHTWRSGVRYAIRAASQLPGRGPTDMDDAPARN